MMIATKNRMENGIKIPFQMNHALIVYNIWIQNARVFSSFFE